MSLDQFRNEMLPAIEAALKEAVQPADGARHEELLAMLAYHMGWEGEGAGIKASGKRIRPTLVLLSCAAAAGVWKSALPAAAAVELLHNFSLIHDDIQDDSKMRRGRPTLWAKWGVAQALNAGDAMFALAHMALEGLEKTTSKEIYIESARLLPRTSLQLTQGQHLDLAYEKRGELNIDAYWPMIWGKTGALIAACARFGALVASASGAQLKAYMVFGEKLGLAFQVHDDLLGIWGDAEQTGKSVHTDLLSGKKSLPILYALQKNSEFAKHWNGNRAAPAEVDEMANLLEKEGARAYCSQQAEVLTSEALVALRAAKPEKVAGAALEELAEELGQREI